MGLITRQIGPDAKGSKLTFADMDNNLYYLQGLGVSGFTYSANTLTITNPTGGTKSVNIASDTNTFITAATYNDLTNTITLTDNANTSFNVYVDSVSGLTVNGVLSATTISGGTLYGDGSNLTGISTQDTFVTGGTYSNGTAIFTNNTGGTFNVTGFTTGNTLQQVLVNGNISNGNNIIMSESDNIIFKYAGYNNNINTNTLTSNRVILFPDNSGTVALLSDIQTFTGGTVTGATNFTNGLTANTISATTYFNLPDNVTGNYLPLSGGTVTGQTSFTSGLTITGDTIITDSTGTSTAIDTSTRELVDSSGLVSVDWRTRLLYNGAGNATINYDGAILYDSTSIPSVDWFSRQTYDDLGVLSIDWQYGRRRLYDVSSNESLDWDIRTLTKSDGSTVSFDWENGILTGQTNIQSSTISATTISGGTLYGDGSNLTGISGISPTLYLLESYANETYTLPGSFTEDPCRYSIVNNTVNVPSGWFNTSTYRFTPQRSGYWEITASYDVYRNTEASLAIKKNADIVAAAGSFDAVAQQITKIVYLNGSTDYISIINVGGASLSRAQYDSRSWFQARWVG
jgi:hypothetical protein